MVDNSRDKHYIKIMTLNTSFISAIEQAKDVHQETRKITEAPLAKKHLEMVSIKLEEARMWMEKAHLQICNKF